MSGSGQNDQSGRASQGDIHWTFETAGRVRSSPAITPRVVLVGSHDDSVYAIDTEGGEPQWQFETSGQIESSPAVLGDTVFVGSHDHNLYALNITTGVSHWEFSTGGPVYTSPTVRDDTVFFGSDDQTVYALDSETGKQVWAFETAGFVRSSATVTEDVVVFGSSDGSVYAVGTATGQSRWQVPTEGTAVYSSPTVSEGVVFAGSLDGRLYAIDIDEGEVLWRFKTGGSVWSSPTVAAGMVFIGSRDGYVYALDIETGEQIWRLDTGNDIFSSPTVVEETLFVGNDDGMVLAIGTTTGAIESIVQTEGKIRSSPTVASGSIYVGSYDRSVYAIDAGTEGVSEDSRVTLGTLGHTPGPTVVLIEDTNAPITAGEPLSVSLNITNHWDEEVTQTIKATIPQVDIEEESITLAEKSSVTTSVSLSTAAADGKEHILEVASEDDTDTLPVTIQKPWAFDVSIVETNSPIQTGNELAVTAEMTNAGETEGEQSVELMVDELGSVSRSILLEPNETRRERFSLSTVGADSGEFLARLASDEVTDSKLVSILSPPAFDVSIVETNSPIQIGNELAVAVEMTNTGETEGEQSVELVVDELGSVSRSILLEPNETRRERFSLSTAGADSGEFLARLASDEVTDSKLVSILSPPAFDVSISRVPNTLTTGEEFEVEVEVTNVGEAQGTKAVEVEVEGISSESATPTLGAKESRTISFPMRVPPDRFDSGEALLITVSTDDDEVTTNVEVTKPATWETADHQQSDFEQRSPATNRPSIIYDEIIKESPIGRGGNADVYRARVQSVDGVPVVALKEPRMSGTLHTEVVDRLLEEAETWQRLDDHDHIVGIVDYGSEPLPWIAMEYMDAGHLGDRREEMSFVQRLSTALATTRAVRHAHRRGIAHLDLKPENVLFQSVEDGWNVPKVADWGLSKHLLEHSKSIEGMSPHYAAPEQFDDSYGSVDDLTDVYQLGAVFYELFTGQPPFEGQPVMVMNNVLHDEPTPPSDIADVPDTLDEVLLTALAKEKSDRYESVLYLRDELQNLSD